MVYLFAFLNVLLIGKIIWFRRFAEKKWGWFKDDHLKVPGWIVFASGVVGIVIPITPLALEGLAVGYLAYFGNEWVYQKTGWSPLRDTIVWIDGWYKRLRKRFV